MRPNLNLRTMRILYAGAGVSLLAIPATAVALAAAPATNADGTATAADQLQIDSTPHKLGFGNQLAVSGTASPADAGNTLVLQFASAGSSSWGPLASTSVAANGSFRVTATLRESGSIRVVDTTQNSTPNVVGAGVGAPASGAGATASSSSRYVAVTGQLHVPAASLNVLGGQPVDVWGRLLPAARGRLLRLQGRGPGAWQTLATARTGPRGRFDLHYLTSALGQLQLRVRFPGDQENARTSAPAGQLTVYQPSVASWYDDAGDTACGFHAYFGVANKELPCGTQVTFRYGGRTVTATVDDRGPFIAGREWDLNQNTASALGFTGVDTVWSSM